MAAGSTYTPIATTTLGSGTTSYTFSSIPSTYTDLYLVINGTASPTSVYLRFNGDTGSNYSQTTLFTYSAGGVYSDRTSNGTNINLTNMYGTQMVAIAQIMNYSNTSTNKTVLGRKSDTYQQTGAVVGLWRSTSAINSVTISSDAAIAAGSVFTLYGIQAA